MMKMFDMFLRLTHCGLFWVRVCVSTAVKAQMVYGKKLNTVFMRHFQKGTLYEAVSLRLRASTIKKGTMPPFILLHSLCLCTLVVGPAQPGEGLGFLVNPPGLCGSSSTFPYYIIVLGIIFCKAGKH